MSENVKTLVFPEGGGSNATDMLLGSMMNGGGMNGGMWNNPIWAIVFLAALRNGGIFGNDGNGNCWQSQISQIQDTLNTNQGNTLLMDAIKGNANSIHDLAAAINCNQNAVTAAINAVQTQICNVGNQVGMTRGDVINAINVGDMNLANTLQSCCCNIRQDVTKMGYENQISNLQQSQLITNGFASVGYAAAENACAIKQNATDNTGRILAKLDAIEDSRKDREIASLTAALTAANSRAERAAELAPITKALSDIQCKQPATVTLPYSCATAVPTAAVYGGTYGGLYGNNPLWN